MSLLPDRILDKIVFDTNGTGCWIWSGRRSRNGYGQVDVSREAKYVHRVVYETYEGAIPPGLDLDHLCRNRACCNPNHLEPVTRSVNLLRGSGPSLTRDRQAAKEYCPAGHPYAGDNLYMYDGRRGCKACRKNATSKYRERANNAAV